MAQIVIFGAGEIAEMAYEYFTHDSPHEVVAFCVEREYLNKDLLYDLPVIPFEEIETRYPPAAYKAFVAISYIRLNRVRTRLYLAAKRMGYECVSYISSRAFVWHNVAIGENCFILEQNVLQHHVKVGNNVVMWSGNHIGHRTVIGDNVFISSHVVVSGYCEIGDNCFLGVNSCVGNSLKIDKDCLIGMGAVIHKSTAIGKVYVGNPAKPIKDTSDMLDDNRAANAIATD